MSEADITHPQSILNRIIFNKKTNKEILAFRGVCSLCKRSETKMVSDNTIAAEGLQGFSKDGSKTAKNFGKN